jgi:hypothetical protein
MKKLKIAVFLFIISMFLITCKKEHIQPSATNGTPIFYFNGTVNGSPVSIDAGVSNYYMYSSYTQGANGLYSFIGNLQQVSGTKSSIEFIINDNRLLSIGGSETNIAASLDTGSYNYYYVGGIPQDSAIFKPSWGTAKPSSYTYNFGDGIKYTGTGNPITYWHIYSHPGNNYKTSLSVLFTDGITDSSSNPLTLHTSGAILTDSVQETIAGNVVTFKCKAMGGSGPYRYMWNFGDSSSISSGLDSSSSPTASHTYDTSFTGVYQALVKVYDASNDSIYSYVSAATSTNSKHLVNYYIPYVYSVPNKLGLSNVTIVYTDPSGQIYTTKDSIQSAGSNFQIVSVSNYQNNENNQTTKMLHVKFNCTLYNGSNSITIKNGDAVIAVAYK